MSANPTVVSNLTTSMDRFQELVGSLTGEQMAVQSLCPEWDVKGVILHVLGVEHILLDWLPEPDDDVPRFADVGSFIGNHSEDDAATITALTASILGQRRRELDALTEADLDRSCMSPVGPATYGQFMDIRNFDIWVHHRDITSPLGLTSDDSGPAAEAALDQVHNSLGYIVGKKIGLPDGMSLTFNVSGPVERSMHVKLDGRAKVVSELDGPASVVVNADSLTFVQLACGRIDPQAQIEAGAISWAGDDEWGRKAASNLAFTM
jgi:uncharacterized protein (TIGR03083 family)